MLNLDVVMRIGAIWYPVTSLGYGRRLGIWFQGCGKNCVNCISPEFKDYTGGQAITIEKIDSITSKFSTIDGLTISGGEPFDQPIALLKVISWFVTKYNDDVLVFTGYSLEKLRKRCDPTINKILDSISVLIDGEYDDNLFVNRGLRGSSNQMIHVWHHKERYEDLESIKRTMQCVMLPDKVWMIGIPY